MLVILSSVPASALEGQNDVRVKIGGGGGGG